MAHTSYNQLLFLLEQLDDPRNDIFLHIDAKFDYFDDKSRIDEMARNVVHSNLIVLPTRLDGGWGELSLVKIEIELYSYALRYAQEHKIDYAIFHLLSGHDLPLHSQDYIHEFIDKHRDQEFLEFNRMPDTVKKLQSRHADIAATHFGEPFGGSQWASLTAKALKILVDKQAEIFESFKGVQIPDESYKQIVLGNSEGLSFAPEGNMRLMFWIHYHPEVVNFPWHEEDMKRSSALFCRKFDIDLKPWGIAMWQKAYAYHVENERL